MPLIKMNDKIFEDGRKRHLLTIGFSKMLKNNFPYKKAFRLMQGAFSNYLIEYYNLVLSDTKPFSQQRFDKFRQHYTKLASKSSYYQIVKSRPDILKVRFIRCPFCEVMRHYKLEDFSSAFCLADLTFTKTVLDGVEFRRKHLISKGDKYCDNTWIFKRGRGH